jgi:hypothetical protein
MHVEQRSGVVKPVRATPARDPREGRRSVAVGGLGRDHQASCVGLHADQPTQALVQRRHGRNASPRLAGAFVAYGRAASVVDPLLSSASLWARREQSKQWGCRADGRGAAYHSAVEHGTGG